MTMITPTPQKPHLIDHWPMPLSRYNAPTRIVDGRVTGSGRTRVCIIGAGLGRGEAPLDDARWEVWALNLCAPRDREQRLRADRWFDLHQRVAQSADDLRWIAACPVPIYLPEDLLDASPRAVRYPLAEIEAVFGGYWACSFAYMIALVLYEGTATDLGLFGVELAFGTERERTVEWANTSYWLGRAEERGLRIHLPQRSLLGRHFARYGLDYQFEIDEVKRYTQMMRDSRSVDDVTTAQGLVEDD